MLTQSNEIGQLQAQFLLQEREIRRARNNMQDQQDAMQKQINDIKKNYSILIEQNPDFLICKRPDWYFEWQRQDVSTGWHVYASSDYVMCFGGNIYVPNTISYKNTLGQTITNDFYIPVYMITNRFDDYWSVPINYLTERTGGYSNPFLRCQYDGRTVADILFKLFEANGSISWSRFDLSNIHDFWIYRIFEFALGGL